MKRILSILFSILILTMLSGPTSAFDTFGQGTIGSVVYGGTCTATYTLGDTFYASSTSVMSLLNGNTSGTMAVLSQTGTGAVSAAPEWTATTGTGNVCRATSPSVSSIHLAAGTAAAGTAPVYMTSGTLLTSPVAGAIEFLTDAYYATITSGTARKTIAFLESPTFTGTVGGISKAMVGLTNVEDTTLSTWGGSTYITTLGTLTGITTSKTITTPGTTDIQTINKPAGRINVTSDLTTMHVINSTVTANSIIMAIAATSDATGYVTSVVAGTGSFDIYFIKPTSEMAINFLIIN